MQPNALGDQYMFLLLPHNVDAHLCKGVKVEI